MDREISKIIECLKELQAHANELGQKGKAFTEHIKAAEDQLEAASRDVQEVKRQHGNGP